jgi:chorismate dehydratase
MPSQSADPSTRLGVVQYLNTKPLVHAFEAGLVEHTFELICDVPSECGRKLHAGETDVAIIPAIEIARAPEPYSVVKGVAIGSLGPVNSVFLVLGEKAAEDITSVALDTSSRSSVALTRILLEKRFGAVPTTIDHAPDIDQMLGVADAAVLIGDLALELDRDRYRVLDLGAAWTEWTGLPFVYACWTGRPGALGESARELLVEARTLGMQHVDTIASAYAAGRSFPPEFYASYLTDSIHFDFGDSELEGLNQFLAYSAELDLISSAPQISFF